MKNLFLLFLPLLCQAETLDFDAPEPARPGAQLPVAEREKFFNFDFSSEGICAGAPAKASQEEYVRWMMARLLAKKKEAVAATAAQYSPISGVKCIHFHAIFGFATIDPNESFAKAKNIRVSCLAGNKKSITHTIYNDVEVMDSPISCGTEERVRNFFTSPAVWNGRAAEDFCRALIPLKGCQYQAVVVNTENTPPPKFADIEKVNKMLSERPDFQLYVDSVRMNRSGKLPKQSSGAKYKNPLADPEDTSYQDAK